MVVDITGQRFGFLTVLCKSDKRDNSRAQFWRIRCDCGTEKEINGAGIRLGMVVSCGCFGREQRRKATSKHGLCHTITYKSWGNMIQRCTNEKHKKYQDYGGRGIKVCDEWLSFENFLADMGERKSPDLSLERIDNEKGYYKENCKWATKSEQMINRRMNKNNTSGVVGVHFNKRKQRFTANIYFDGKNNLLGYFKTLEEASNARKQAEYWRSQLMGKRVAKT